MVNVESAVAAIGSFVKSVPGKLGLAPFHQRRALLTGTCGLALVLASGGVASAVVRQVSGPDTQAALPTSAPARAPAADIAAAATNVTSVTIKATDKYAPVAIIKGQADAADEGFASEYKIANSADPKFVVAGQFVDGQFTAKVDLLVATNVFTVCTRTVAVSGDAAATEWVEFKTSSPLAAVRQLTPAQVKKGVTPELVQDEVRARNTVAPKDVHQAEETNSAPKSSTPSPANKPVARPAVKPAPTPAHSPAPKPSLAPVPATAPAPKPAPKPAPAPAPAPAPEWTPPVDQARYIVTDANYDSSCRGEPAGYSGPGPGGTIAPSFDVPWSYYQDGNRFYFVACP